MELEIKKKSLMMTILRGGFFVVFILFLGGVGAVVTDRFVFPAISSKPAFSRYKFLRRLAEDVTVITKTEQITVQEDDSIGKVANRVANSVVNIVSLENKMESSRASLLSGRAGMMNGTGVIITGDGVIASYRTGIIEKNANYQVMLHDGNMVSAVLVGVDEFTNLAFLKIESSNLPIISLASDSDAQVGKKLIYVANAGSDYQNEYSLGLLSERDQTLNIAGKVVSSSEKLEGAYRVSGVESTRFVGGPAVTYQGNMIGIVGSMTLNNDRTFFTIPVSAVQSSLARVVEGNEDQRPFLGIYYLPITRSLVKAQSLNRDSGALVYSPSGKQGLAVLAGSPAEKAGIMVGDIIAKVGDREVTLNNSLSNLIAEYTKGDTVELVVFRAGKEIVLTVQL